YRLNFKRFPIVWLSNGPPSPVCSTVLYILDFNGLLTLGFITAAYLLGDFKRSITGIPVSPWLLGILTVPNLRISHGFLPSSNGLLSRRRRVALWCPKLL
ncbi:unnamed protein product, partial [Laminaria digitata]